ncbi:MAG: hypothetical protein AB1758_35325, partial [Candidatus Eremiobacterota bacterium]
VWGKPTHDHPAVPGPDGRDTGNIAWGEGEYDLLRGINAKLNDGVGDDHVFNVYLVGVRAVTDRGLYLGAPEAKVRRIYPEATRIPPGGMNEGWLVPGLRMVCYGGFVREFVVEPR